MNTNALDRLIGSSKVMRQLREDITRAAKTGARVLVTGPTGSGKELVVEAIHELSRPGTPFVALNCGEFPEHLMESLLFGHKKGAFTGADQDHEGLLSSAGAGTVFLDEIAELPLMLQVKLLRVLEKGEFRAVGSLVVQKFQGRVVAATHADLAERVEEQKFRRDLRYRLDVITVRVPALSERREDVAELVTNAMQEHGRLLKLTPSAWERLRSNAWEGNVRELRNVVERLIANVQDEADVHDVERALDRPVRKGQDAVLETIARVLFELPASDKLKALERVMIRLALEESQGNITHAAQRLGIHRKALERRVVAWRRSVWSGRAGPYHEAEEALTPARSLHATPTRATPAP